MVDAANATPQESVSWSTWHQALSVLITARSLKRSAFVAVIVGSAFFAMNQLALIMAGRATALVWLKAALTYLTPLVVSNIGMLSATHRPGTSSHP